jgi:hypothetical protein
MNSTTTANARNPDDILVARADERLAHAYEQIARADDQLSRVTEQLSRLEQGPVRHPSAVLGSQPSRGKSALRGVTGLVLAAGIGAAAYALQASPYAESAKAMIAQWAPHGVSTSPLALAKPGDPATTPATVQLASAETMPSQAPPAVQSPAQEVAPASAPASPELTQMLQSMARDIATLEQGIEQLKANQERMAADNARAIGELKASQEQMAHLVVKPPVQDTRAKTAAPPAPKPVAAAAPKPIAAAAHKPPPAAPPPARAHSQPIQLQPDDQ